jgi:hypothetical protein
LELVREYDLDTAKGGLSDESFNVAVHLWALVYRVAAREADVLEAGVVYGGGEGMGNVVAKNVEIPGFVTGIPPFLRGASSRSFPLSDIIVNTDFLNRSG